MEKFDKHRGVAAPLNMINIDTDKLIPKQFLKTIKRTGLGKYLFNEIRFNADGSENEDFVLNKPAYRDASILVAGDNFGCGSSREHAVWALRDFGIKAVIASSFGDIFYNNCFKNSVLPIKLEKNYIEMMFNETKDDLLEISIDIQKKEINLKQKIIKFEESEVNWSDDENSAYILEDR